MKTIIESIPHATHRYPTCGDWYYQNDTLHIKVSAELPAPSRDLVVLHELAEVMMCGAAGISQEQVDAFDTEYEKNRKEGDESEPGDHPDAPYFKQHQAATIIERIAASMMGVNWDNHCIAVELL